jgi:hypothetical protein
MFPKSRTSSNRPAPMMIIPVRPGASASDARAAGTPAGLLRRTLPSRRTFGRSEASRRTFGRNLPSRRTFGLGHPSRRTFGRYTPSRRTFGISHP